MGFKPAPIGCQWHVLHRIGVSRDEGVPHGRVLRLWQVAVSGCRRLYGGEQLFPQVGESCSDRTAEPLVSTGCQEVDPEILHIDVQCADRLNSVDADQPADRMDGLCKRGDVVAVPGAEFDVAHGEDTGLPVDRFDQLSAWNDSTARTNDPHFQAVSIGLIEPGEDVRRVLQVVQYDVLAAFPP